MRTKVLEYVLGIGSAVMLVMLLGGGGLLAAPPLTAPAGDLNRDGNVDALDIQCMVLTYGQVELAGEVVSDQCVGSSDCVAEFGANYYCRPGFNQYLVCMPTCLDGTVALGGDQGPVCDNPDVNTAQCLGLVARHKVDLNCDAQLTNVDFLFLVGLAIGKMGGPGTSDLDQDNLLNFCDDDSDGDEIQDETDCYPLDPALGDCDDGNQCTTDTCDPVTGCDHVTVADGTPCTLAGPGQCSGGICVLDFEPETIVFAATGTSQTLVVPDGVSTVTITAEGAQGGASAGGRGAYHQGTFDGLAGKTLTIRVGKRGTPGNCSLCGSGGGGGSFIFTSAMEILVIAGGGGGKSYHNDSGKPGNASAYASAGAYGAAALGYGGKTCADCGGGMGAGGGGWLTNGASNTWSGGGSKQGGPGGLGKFYAVHGGYGGGGGGMHGGGGGGGYTGGSGGNSDVGAGGGGSYNTGYNQSSSTGTNYGDGSVVIEMQ